MGGLGTRPSFMRVLLLLFFVATGATGGRYGMQESKGVRIF